MCTPLCFVLLQRNKQCMEQLAQYPVTFGALAEPMYTPSKTPDGRYMRTFRTPGYDMASCVRTKGHSTDVDDLIRPKLAPQKARKKRHEDRDIDPAKTKYAWMTCKERSDAVKAAQARKVRSRGTLEQKEKELRMKDKKSIIPLSTSSLIQAKLTPKVPPKVESRIPLKQRSMSAKPEGKSSTVLPHSVRSIKWATKRPSTGRAESKENAKTGDEETEKKNGDRNAETEKECDGDTHEETKTPGIDCSEDNDDKNHVPDDDSFWISDVEDIEE